MRQALAPTISDDSRTRLMLAIAVPQTEGEVKGLVEVAAELGISTADVVALLNDPNFMKGVRALTKAQANLALHGEGIKGLIDIALNGNDREKLTALKLLGQLTGDLKAGTQVEVKITFDDLRKRESDDPLTGLFDIRNANVIDAEVSDVD
jgi:hypothetical protein